jgi:hypothetical protein
MHSHDRTLLARLGFDDPDRRDPLHEIACRYLAVPTVARRLAGLLDLEYMGLSQRTQRYRNEVRWIADRYIKTVSAKCEHEVSKGERQYRTTVGFVDVCLRIELEERHRDIQEHSLDFASRNEPWCSHEDRFETRDVFAAIEVKTTEVPVSDVVRQIRLYQSYGRFTRWLVATTYPMTQSQVDWLGNARVLHVFLGQGFQDFVKDQANSPISKSVEV